MKKDSLFKFFAAVFLGCLPLLVFWLGYHATHLFFKMRIVPYPFERIGIAVSLGSAFWTAALVLPVIRRLERR